MKIVDGFNYRNYVANDDFENGRLVFNTLVEQGLKPEHTICDVGCGSLRVGRYILEYINKGNYCAIEPNMWLVEEAELNDKIDTSSAKFDSNRDFDIDKKVDFALISAVLIHVDHDTLRQALNNVCDAAKVVIFDTYQHGPDHTDKGWLYPQIACHADSCILAIKPEAKHLHMDYRGAQWWRIDTNGS